jgi:hypothetical protein
MGTGSESWGAEVNCVSKPAAAAEALTQLCVPSEYLFDSCGLWICVFVLPRAVVLTQAHVDFGSHADNPNEQCLQP